VLSLFRITNFKSYKDASLELAPLTVLIGANASGKSNVIEGLRLLSWVLQGNRLGAIRYAVQEQDRAIRGKVSDLGYRGAASFTLACDTTDPDWDHYAITLERREDDDLHIRDERLTGPRSAVPLFEVVALSEGAGSDLRVAYNNFARGGKKPQLTASDQMAILVQLQSSARFEGGHRKAQKEIPQVTSRYQDWLSRITFLDPSPRAMRDYSFKTDETLRETGANLSGVLFNLCQCPEGRKSILDFIRALPEQDITAIDFLETPRGEVMVRLTETFGDTETQYDATLLSDGTLRVLSIAAAILSAPEHSLVVIEEIDNGVHPSRAEQLLGRISDIAKQRQLRVLISSHNPALLDALPEDAVPNVVFCFRDPKDGASRLVRLQDIPHYPQLIAQGSVGHLMTRGLIETFVKDQKTAGERSKETEKWLDELFI